MIRRVLLDRVLVAARRFPVVTITGPRQSGKTTLARSAFPDKPYANLELPDVREFAASDARGFLAQFPRGALLDEVQRVPGLLSYLQALVDEGMPDGAFILTGSQHFGLLARVSQSLAGRTAVLHLLPLGLEEIRRFPDAPTDLFRVLHAGGYPRIHDRRLPAGEWLAAYTETYVERDVRQLLRVGDLGTFQTFLRLCAGRVGQLLNLSALGADAGISHTTARAWLSVLEAGFLVYRLPPFHRNLGKRLTKSPKLYFYDSGLLCYLLGIRREEELRLHPLRGPVFESWVVSEILKSRLHRGLPPDLCFYRDQKGTEVDVVLEEGTRLVAIEIKSGQTVAPDAWASLEAFVRGAARARIAPGRLERLLVYGGDEEQRRTHATALPWSRIDSVDWTRGAVRRLARPRRRGGS
ncbi:MAG: ATP-binding protein [Planctomycetes bacterium]|nr:ATP-binding protein [Planctomycetota bacterium]